MTSANAPKANGDARALGHPEDRTDGEDTAAGRRWSHLIRLELFPHGLQGISALTEHGLEQPLLCFFTFSLNSGKCSKRPF